MPAVRSKEHEHFSKADLAELLNVHPQTVVRYGREFGLSPLGGSRPRVGNSYALCTVADFVRDHFKGLEPKLVAALSARRATASKVMKLCRKLRAKGGAA